MRTPLSTKFEAALFGSLTKKQGTAEDKKRAAGVMAARSAAIADSATGDELDAEAKKGTKKAIDTIRGILSGVAGAEEAILHLDLAAAAVGSGDRAAVVEHLEEVSEALGGEDEETEKVSGGPGEHSRHPYPSEQGGGKSEGGGAETGASPEKIRAKLTSSLDQLGQAHGKALQRLDPKDEIGFAFNEVARKDPATKGAAREFNAGLKEQRAKLKERHKELGNRARKVGMAEDEIMFVALDQIDHLSTSIADAGDDSGSGVTLIGQGKSLVRDYERAAKTLDKVEQRVARREQRK